MYHDQGMNVKEQGMMPKSVRDAGREAPLEDALKQLHHYVVKAEEQFSNLEARLNRITAPSALVHTAGSLHGSGRPTPAPALQGRSASEMTIEIQQLGLRLEALADRIQCIIQNVDC